MLGRLAAVALAVLGVLWSTGCGDDDDDASGSDAGAVDAALDAAAPDAGPALPPLARGLPPTAELGTAGPYQLARAVIHFHSPLSHDACDGEGWVDGVIDEECLDQMRFGICETHQDVVFATDHDDYHAETPFPDVFLMRADDEAVLDDYGMQIGSAIHCQDGHMPVFVTGEENEIMPVGLQRHLDAVDAQELHDLYNGDDLRAADAMRAAGALVLINHAEHWTADHVEAIGATGMELYNFHANVDLEIREQVMGLPSGDALAAAINFMLDQAHPEPDLALTAFLEENEPDLVLFDTLHARGVRVAGFLGNDVHQNSLPGMMSDGERGDSYRRLLRWMSNYFLVPDRSPQAVLEALAAGRLYSAFDALGTPLGFDFAAEDVCEDRVEMGATTSLDCAPVLRLQVPAVYGLDASAPAPAITAAIVRVDGAGREEVATGSSGEVAYEPDAPGVFRPVVRITPEHLRPYYHGADADYVREFIWIYGNPIHVEQASGGAANRPE